MKLRMIVGLLAGGFVLAIAQFSSTFFFVPALAWVVAAAIGLFCFWLFDFLQSGPGFWTPWITATLASFIGVLPDLVTGKDELLAAAPVVAFLVAGLNVLVDQRHSRRCSLCLRGLDANVAFTCPRCGLVVCDEGCWDFDRCRCRLCVQNKVPAFLDKDGRWWDQQFGGKATVGRCAHCLAAAGACDLRACPKCSRAQCRACWDESNGECVHCGWILPELPPQLSRYMLPAGNARPG